MRAIKKESISQRCEGAGRWVIILSLIAAIHILINDPFTIFYSPFTTATVAYGASKIPAIIVPYDTVTMPGVEVWPQAMVMARRFYAVERPVGGERIEFLEDDRSLGLALTGGDGIGVIRHIPYREGMHRIRVRLLSTSAYEAVEAEMIIGVWERRKPLLLVSVDALRERPKEPLFPFLGSAKKDEERRPLPQSVGVLSEMAERFNILYLYRGEISRIPGIRSWLSKQGFPAYPLLIPGDDKGSFNKLLSDRKDDIKGVVVTPEDEADIFRKEEIRTFLLVEKKREAEYKDEKGTTVVKDWKEIRKSLL